MTQNTTQMNTSRYSGTVGWCGLGAMGAVMAPRLRDVTDRLTGYDLNPKAAQAAGLQRAEQLSELSGADCVITMPARRADRPQRG